MSQADRPLIPYTEVEQLREARSVLRAEADAIGRLADQVDASFCEAVNLVLNRSGSVIVTGIGKAGLIGQKIVATLSSTGTRSYFLHPTEAVHGDLGCVHQDDVVLAISNSGETDELVRLLPVFAQMNVPVLAMTSSANNSLARGATVVITTGQVSEAGAHGLAPSTSTTTMLALGDALALVLSRMKGFSPGDFARLHPGGSLGRKLQTVKDIMRSPGQFRMARQNVSIRDVLTNVHLPHRRSGAIILTDDNGIITGLFTDSDLVRLLESRHDNYLDRPISESMTQSPLTTSPDVLVTDAVAILSEKKFSELPVVDQDNRPVGLVDITDVIGYASDSTETSVETGSIALHANDQTSPQISVHDAERESA
jgi:arabinose-5-phosphate isomerase